MPALPRPPDPRQGTVQFPPWLSSALAAAVVAVLTVALALALAVARREDSSEPPRPAPFEERLPDRQGAVVTYHVSPLGDDQSPGSREKPLATIQKAVDLAGAGATVQLGEGTYRQDVRTRRNGTMGAPITISGPPTAVVQGAGAGRVFEVNHDHHVLQGFTIDGLHGPPVDASGYRDKLLFVQGKQKRSGVTGLRVLDMTIENAGGECVRFRYFAQRNEIAGTTITNCGVFDFRFGGGGKNGEGIYIGTAPEQTGDGKNPTDDPDQSNDNLIHDNRVDTQGNECVDIKEGATGNVVERNSCTGQLDPDSGGLDARGNDNVFRDNLVEGNEGAGIRLGGDETDDGTGNHVYGNTIRRNEGGGIKFMRVPQGQVCGNVMSANARGSSVGEYGERFDPTARCRS